ncbi:hypothetical protein [Tenacibaculum sp. nBUS_03]|uniref:hypothetical protein n=1 Tax=Tenacibaculum sp. nBUS_03 TaxID=3395320 RepID=UPI003EB695AB
MQELQTIRFNEQKDEIFKPTATSQTLQFEKGIVKSAKINTYSKISTNQIKALMSMADSWDFDNIEISRSGAGLKIEFLDYNAKKAESRAVYN